MDTEILNKLLEGQQKIAKRLSSIESQQEENNQILRALEHNSEIHKAEMDNFTHQVAETKGELINFRSETNEKLEDIKDDIAFLTKKETENEKDIFKLSKKVQ